MLCASCEQRFGNSEREFSNNVFAAFHANDQDEFAYGPWLHYFMTSLAWRTLILDLPGLEADAANPPAVVGELVTAAETMRRYLLGATNLAVLLRNHAVAWTKAHSACAALAAVGPNVMLRRSVFGYTLLHRLHGYAGILHNLAGFMCFLIVKGDLRNTWSGTKVNPLGGQIKQPQRVSSWLMGELLTRIAESAKAHAAMSNTQRRKIEKAMRGNSTARAFRFRELDNHITVSD